MKRIALLNAGVIKNIALWDGVQPWTPSLTTEDVTGRKTPIIGNTLIQRTPGATHNILIDGNSITIAQWSGASHLVPGGYNAIQNAILDMGLTRNDYINAAVNGRATNSLLGFAHEGIDSYYDSKFGKKNVCILWEGTNDLYLHQDWSGQRVYDNIKAYGIGRKNIGWTFIAGTVLPRISVDTDQESRRLVVNQLLRDAKARGEFWLDEIADVGADPLMGNPATCTANQLYYYDATHLSELGHFMCSPIFRAAIERALA